MQYTNGYQPSRSQHLCMAKLVKDKYNIDGEVIVHYVLIDSPTRFYIQAEIHRNIIQDGVTYKAISFERLEV